MALSVVFVLLTRFKIITCRTHITAMLCGVLELRHPCCVCNIKVQFKEVKNTTSLLSVNGVVHKTTCFGLLRGHHQVQQVLAIGD